MNEESEPRGGKLSTYLLLAITILFIILITVHSVIDFQGVNRLARSVLTDETADAHYFANRIIFERRMEPLKRFSAAKPFPSTSTVGEIVQNYPEIIEVIVIDEDGGYNTIFTAAPSAKVHDIFRVLAPKILDTLKTSFTNAYWDTTIKQADILIQSPDSEYLLSYLKMDDNVTILALDPHKLAEVLPEVFDYEVKTNPHIGDYFSGLQPYSAEIKIMDRGGREIFSYGEAGGYIWEDILETELKPMTWKMTTQLYAEDEKLVASATHAGNIPWIVIIEGLIAAVCGIVLALRKR